LIKVQSGDTVQDTKKKQSPVIKIDICHPRKKERKESRVRPNFGLERTDAGGAPYNVVSFSSLGVWSRYSSSSEAKDLVTLWTR